MVLTISIDTTLFFPVAAVDSGPTGDVALPLDTISLTEGALADGGLADGALAGVALADVILAGVALAGVTLVAVPLPDAAPLVVATVT